MLAVIGAGFNGTGTAALRQALERLGFGPCHDLDEFLAHPARVPGWEEAIAGGTSDWDRLLAGYRSAVGWPACHFWRELADRYPAAKVVLTVREPHAWYRSAEAAVFRPMADPPASRGGKAAWQLVRKLVRQTFGASTGDESLAVDALRLHEEEVQRTLAPERLLVFDVTEGWAPLCRFLDAEMPEEPFPTVSGA